MKNQDDSSHGKPHQPQNPDYSGGQKKHHWVMWILVIVAILLLIGAFFVFRPRKPKPQPPPPISITTTNAQKGDIQVSVTALGSVQPVYVVAISPRVDGQVVSVNYTEGQMVRSNDLLAVIDPAPYEAQVLQAEGQLARDQALLEGAKIDLERYQTALQKNAIPKQQYDDELALVHQDEGTVKFDQGQMYNAQVQSNYCYIRAPISGRVGLRLIDPGNIVHAANTNALLMIAQLQPINVVFNVAEDYLPDIQQQLKENDLMAVEAYDRAQEKKVATGTFLTLDNLIDTSTGTIKIKSVFTNEDMELFPNQFVNAKLIIRVLHDVTLIPTFAIQRNPDSAFVYVVTNASETTNGMTTNFQAVVMRNITTGTVDGETTQVTKGLQPGETIALDNFNKLGDNVKIAIRKPGAEEKPRPGDPDKNKSHKKKDAQPKDGS